MPLDGSALAEQALPLAQQLALAGNTTLMLVAAVPPIDDIGLAMAGVEPMWMLADNQATDEREKGYLSNIAQRLRATGITVHTRCVWGVPAKAILDTSTDVGVELVVMTTPWTHGCAALVVGQRGAQGDARHRRTGAARASTSTVSRSKSDGVFDRPHDLDQFVNFHRRQLRNGVPIDLAAEHRLAESHAFTKGTWPVRHVGFRCFLRALGLGFHVARDVLLGEFVNNPLECEVDSLTPIWILPLRGLPWSRRSISSSV